MYNLVYENGNITETILTNVPKPLANYKKKILSANGYSFSKFKLIKYESVQKYSLRRKP